jgi:alpha-galactosidase
VLAPSRSGEPLLLHWGRDLGDLTEPDLAGLHDLNRPGVPHSALDLPRSLGLVPDGASGFAGTPALEGWRLGAGGRAWSPRLRDWTWSPSSGPDSSVRLDGRDPEAGWAVAVHLELTREGVVRLRTEVTNTGPGALALSAVRQVLPVAADAVELLDLTGRWCRERVPQRQPWTQGTHLRQGRHGRTGHDATLLLLAGTSGFGFRSGTVWGVHTAWSGDHTTYAERTPEGESLLGGGELLGPGEVVLEPGETYAAPWLLGSWSADGMDGLSARLHAWTRRHAPRSRSPRPVLLNTWEATYFDHDLDRLRTLADTAAAVGVERFVLDDGWFAGRRHDRAGLGDWTVDPDVWPDGLLPLIDHVRGLGMDFGLWVEPEMVNEDSDLVRNHPSWVLRGHADLPPGWRHQQVLDLQVPEAYAHVRDALSALLRDHDIAFLKWDHNRDLVDTGHQGRPAVHGQTLAVYRLLDELRAAHPDLEVESCASGGGRVDLGVLARTDRVWPSDTIDALERQRIQRWTTLLVPPEMLGAHLGGPRAHTTGRTQPLAFRAATALLGHFGIEWDLTMLDEPDLATVRAWVELHKSVRRVLNDGTTVRVDHPDPAVLVSGVVAADRSEAWFVVATIATTATQTPSAIRLPGLTRDARYHVESVTPPGDQHAMDLGESWLEGPGIVVPGSGLADVGVRMPVLAPETAHVLHLSRREGGELVA